jgi:ribonuclease HII
MPYLLGTDEAGYGPNLGPLLITGTLWQLPEALAEADLYEVLADVVTVARRDPCTPKRLSIADSKALYRSGDNLCALEQGVFATLELLKCAPRTWQEIWDRIAPQCAADREQSPWYRSFDRSLPGHVDIQQVQKSAGELRCQLQQVGISLQAVRSVAVFPGRFNALLQQYGNKGLVLSWTTIDLIKDLMSSLPDESVLVQCDKHGGRNRYSPLLQQAFPEYLVEIHREDREQSIYRWGPTERRVECRFTVKGERFLPSALASMYAKYLRELAMMALNDFWQGYLPHLRPTAGYPADARRFKKDIAAVQKRLDIPDSLLWRNR